MEIHKITGGRKMTKIEIMEKLQDVFEDLRRLYIENGKGDYEAGKLEGAQAVLDALDKILID